MSTGRRQPGRLAQRPHYTLRQIERICLDALEYTGSLPSTPGPVRIDRFIEKYFKLSPSYASLPEGVLGYTEFDEVGVRAIVVTTALDEEGSRVADRRVRTTLAHEAGHGLLHAHLFGSREAAQSLFEGEADSLEIMCRDVQGARAPSRGYDGRWWEYQANRAIGSLLMPGRLVTQAASPFCQRRGHLGHAFIKEDLREQAVHDLAETFDVNPVVARIRLTDIMGSADNPQLAL